MLANVISRQTPNNDCGPYTKFPKCDPSRLPMTQLLSTRLLQNPRKKRNLDYDASQRVGASGSTDTCASSRLRFPPQASFVSDHCDHDRQRNLLVGFVRALRNSTFQELKKFYKSPSSPIPDPHGCRSHEDAELIDRCFPYKN